MVKTTGDKEITGDAIANSIKLDTLTSDPGSPVEGQVWYNSTDKVVKVNNGTSSDPIRKGVWKLKEKRVITTAVASTSFTFSPAVKMIKVFLDIVGDTSTQTTVEMQLNGITASGYGTLSVGNTLTGAYATTTYMPLSDTFRDTMGLTGDIIFMYADQNSTLDATITVWSSLVKKKTTVGTSFYRGILVDSSLNTDGGITQLDIFPDNGITTGLKGTIWVYEFQD